MIAVLLPLLLLVPAPPPGDDPLVPPSAILARDTRPLAEQKRQLLADALDLEKEALDRQSTLPFAKPENIAAERRRIDAMRSLLDRPIERDRLSPRALSLLDRYLVQFALDRLEAEGADVATVTTWTDANRRYLATGNLGDREAAFEARIHALRSLTRGAILRRFLLAVENGTLDDASRQGFVEALRKEFPGTPIPGAPSAGAAFPLVPGGSAGPSPFLVRAGGAAAASSPSSSPADLFRRLRPFPRQEGSESLPRLDGIERPLGEVKSLAQVLAAMQGS